MFNLKEIISSIADVGQKLFKKKERLPSDEITQFYMDIASSIQEVTEDVVLKIAKKIASKSNLTIKIGKQTFYKQLEMPLRKAYAHTSKMMTINMMALDAKEGISAFIEKRKPIWKNK